MFDDLTVNGIPLIVLVFGLAEAFKSFGVRGNALTIISLALGVLLYFAYYVSNAGLPGAFSGWLTVIVTGLAFGLTASGLYDFINARWRVRGK